MSWDTVPNLMFIYTLAGHWPKWSLDEVVMDEMAMAEMGLDEREIGSIVLTMITTWEPDVARE